MFSGKYELKCHECPKWTEERQRMRGCIGKAPTPILEFEEVDYYECLGKLIHDDVSFFLEIYAFCKALNKLPVEGGLLDQTWMFVQAARRIENICAILDKEEYEKLEKEKHHG